MRHLKAAAMLLVAFGLMMTLSACEEEHHPAESKGGATAIVLVNFQLSILAPDGPMAVAQGQVDPMIKAANAVIAAAMSSSTRVNAPLAAGPHGRRPSDLSILTTPYCATPTECSSP
jgi:hypothetical protein